MTISVEDLTVEMASALKDSDHVRWSEDDLVAYINAAMIATVNRDPRAYVVTIPFKLAAGADQVVPTDCVKLFELTMNLGREWTSDTYYTQGQMIHDGTTRYKCVESHRSSALFVTDAAKWEVVTYLSGPGIDTMHEANLEQYYGQGWKVIPYEESIDFEPLVLVHVLRSDQSGNESFSVYPPQPSQGQMYVAARCGKIPDAIDIYGNVPFNRKYREAVFNYAMFRAFSKDADDEANTQQAQGYLGLFSSDAAFL